MRLILSDLELLHVISGLVKLEALHIKQLRVVTMGEHESPGSIHSEHILQFFNLVASHSMKHFSLDLWSFPLADGPDVSAGIWNRVAQLIREPRFPSFTRVTIILKGILWEQRESLIEPLLPLQQSGLVEILPSVRFLPGLISQNKS